MVPGISYIDFKMDGAVSFAFESSESCGETHGTFQVKIQIINVAFAI
jgi:hypothetical protein